MPAGQSLAGAPDLRSQLPAASAQMSVDVSAVVGQVATMSEAAQSRAGTIIDQIPDTILARARNVTTVVPLVLGLLLSPTFAGAAMSLSSVSVIANALRLRRVKL